MTETTIMNDILSTETLTDISTDTTINTIKIKIGKPYYIYEILNFFESESGNVEIGHAIINKVHYYFITPDMLKSKYLLHDRITVLTYSFVRDKDTENRKKIKKFLEDSQMTKMLNQLKIFDNQDLHYKYIITNMKELKSFGYTEKTRRKAILNMNKIFEIFNMPYKAGSHNSNVIKIWKVK